MFFLFTLEWQDLYIAGGILVGFASAFIVLTGATAAFKKTIYTPLHAKFVEPVKANNKLLETLSAAVLELEKHNEKIAHEVSLNNGSSIKDEVRHIKRGVQYAISKIRYWDEIATDALFEMDGSGNLKYANKCLCELMDCDEADLKNKNWIVRVMPNERQSVLREWQLAIENKCPVDSLQTVISGYYAQGASIKRRNIVKVRVQATPQLDEKGNLIGFFGWMTKTDDVIE